MRGTVSFHPVNLEFFDSLIQPLLAGDKVNPDGFAKAAVRVHENSKITGRYVAALV